MLEWSYIRCLSSLYWLIVPHVCQSLLFCFLLPRYYVAVRMPSAANHNIQLSRHTCKTNWSFEIWGRLSGIREGWNKPSRQYSQTLPFYDLRSGFLEQPWPARLLISSPRGKGQPAHLRVPGSQCKQDLTCSPQHEMAASQVVACCALKKQSAGSSASASAGDVQPD